MGKLGPGEGAPLVHGRDKASGLTYAGVYFVALATLSYEILMTRIFSVTMYYHFAFMAISITMFGMTVGALWVYLRSDYSDPVRAKQLMAANALNFGVSSIVSFLVHLIIPCAPLTLAPALFLIALIYIVMSAPFMFSGICMSLALTKFPNQVSKLYAADLAGAASGCVVVIYALKVADGPSAIFIVGFLATAGAIFFSFDARSTNVKCGAIVVSAGLAALVAINTAAVRRQMPLVRLIWVKGHAEPRPIYEKWNSFSRVSVRDDQSRRNVPFGWGLSPAYSGSSNSQQLFLNIDANAETVLTAFNGSRAELQYLKYDVINLAHYIRPDSRVLVIGAGGGRDVLSALVFGQRSASAVELNEEIIHAVNNRFGDFTGNLDRQPGVTFVNDEARSYVARSKDRFDIVQISFTDTWAATAAGAFVLAENSLYTLQAWNILLDHLTQRGVLSVSRWYSEHLPGEVYRATSLATATLLRRGISRPQEHIIVVRCMRRRTRKGIESGPAGVATVLIGREPFSPQDMDTVEEISQRMQFQIILSPRSTGDSTLSSLVTAEGLNKVIASFPLDISPPTDDRPFFFDMLRLRDLFHPKLQHDDITAVNEQAVSVLVSLLVIVFALSALCVIAPLSFATKRETLRGTLNHFIFFAGIGFGFMLIEVSQMQRLIVFLGHPTYGLSVVLFALLLSTGLGSWLTRSIHHDRLRPSGTLRLVLLIGVLLAFGLLTAPVITASQSSTTMHRILIAIAILFPAGISMGMAFPLGLKLALSDSESLGPWLWGINGAASVCGSVLAVVIATSAGITACFWTGLVCYVAASAAFARQSRVRPYLRIDC